MQHICVTGASSGLGRALAVSLAKQGCSLVLWARDETRLRETASLCERAGAEVTVVSQDIRDYAATCAKLEQMSGTAPFDQVFLASGVITGTSPGGAPESLADTMRTFEVNLLGSVNMAMCLLESMKKHGRGHLVFVSSIAGLYPLPHSPAYSASKIGVSSFARALAAETRGSGVRISCVYPGYLDTPMGRRLKAPAKPMVIEAGRAAEIILHRLESGKDRIVFPRVSALGVFLLHMMPKGIADRLAEKLGYTVEPDEEARLTKNTISAR